jgi:galactokinase
MDQFINLHGESGKVLKLDCRSLDYELVPFDRDDICIVLCDSKVSHNLASSEYNVRRSQCEEGVNHFKKYDSEIKNLRDISFDLFDKHADELEPLIRQRCRFVLEENQRVHDACDALIKGDFESLGEKLLGSHYGLSKDYEVSCEELDILVELAKDKPGVFGCRMMGGGFGGCTINLVLENKVEDFASSMKTEYKAKTGIDTEVHVMKIAAGTHLID